MTTPARQPQHCDHECVCEDYHIVMDDEDPKHCNIAKCIHDTRLLPDAITLSSPLTQHYAERSQATKAAREKVLGLARDMYGLMMCVKKEKERQKEDKHKIYANLADDVHCRKIEGTRKISKCDGCAFCEEHGIESNGMEFSKCRYPLKRIG